MHNWIFPYLKFKALFDSNETKMRKALGVYDKECATCSGYGDFSPGYGDFRKCHECNGKGRIRYK